MTAMAPVISKGVQRNLQTPLRPLVLFFEKFKKFSTVDKRDIESLSSSFSNQNIRAHLECTVR